MDNLFEQMANISKAHAYDIVSKQRNELVEQNKELRNALNKILDEIQTTDASYIVDNPAPFVTKIARICLDTLKQNKPL